MATMVTMNSILLHYAGEKIKTLETNKNSLRYELYMELDAIAWDSTVSINKKYVTGIQRHYDCDAVKTNIETYLKQYNYEKRRYTNTTNLVIPDSRGN